MRDIIFDEYSFYNEYTLLKTKELVILIPEFLYSHKITEDSNKNENDWVPRLLQVSHKLLQGQRVNRYT